MAQWLRVPAMVHVNKPCMVSQMPTTLVLWGSEIRGDWYLLPEQLKNNSSRFRERSHLKGVNKIKKGILCPAWASKHVIYAHKNYLQKKNELLSRIINSYLGICKISDLPNTQNSNMILNILNFKILLKCRTFYICIWIIIRS